MTRDETKLVAMEVVRLERREKWHRRWRFATFALLFGLLVLYFSQKQQPQFPDCPGKVQVQAQAQTV